MDELRQAIESLHASCWALSAIVETVSFAVARTGNHLRIAAVVTAVDDMNKIPTVPVIEDRGDGYDRRYRVIKYFAGAEFNHYCDSTEVKRLLLPQETEVAADASA